MRSKILFEKRNRSLFCFTLQQYFLPKNKENIYDIRFQILFYYNFKSFIENTHGYEFSFTLREVRRREAVGGTWNMVFRQ